MIAPVSLTEILTTEPPPPNWLVEGLFLKGLIVVLAGDAGAGKTALSCTLAHCLALGVPFLQHVTTPTTVCYFDEENSEVDFRRYNQWIWHGLGAPAVERYADRLNFYHFAITGPWYEPMREVALAKKPGLIVIDTANPVLNIVEENSNDEAGHVMKRLRLIQKTNPEMTILILKHERQRDDMSHRRTIRGAKTWLSSADRTFYHVIPSGCRKRKNGLRHTALVPDKLRSYGLEVPLGIDPEWTDESRKGLILKGILGDYRGLKKEESD